MKGMCSYFETKEIALPDVPHTKHLKICFSAEIVKEGSVSSWNGQTATKFLPFFVTFKYEEIIFTLNGTRNVILFNIKTGEIIKKFKQNDFFFDSDKKTPLSCEGMFSKKGDYFAITTYSGSLSIFSIYTKNSYMFLCVFNYAKHL
jgi:hypothetical protein